MNLIVRTCRGWEYSAAFYGVRDFPTSDGRAVTGSTVDVHVLLHFYSMLNCKYLGTRYIYINSYCVNI